MRVIPEAPGASLTFFSSSALCVPVHHETHAPLQDMCVNSSIRCPRCFTSTSVADGCLGRLYSNCGLGNLEELSIQSLPQYNVEELMDKLGAVCPVCLEAYSKLTVPSILSCGHNVCEVARVRAWHSVWGWCFVCPLAGLALCYVPSTFRLSLCARTPSGNELWTWWWLAGPRA